jgi:hypothetical protein
MSYVKYSVLSMRAMKRYLARFSGGFHLLQPPDAFSVAFFTAIEEFGRADRCACFHDALDGD